MRFEPRLEGGEGVIQRDVRRKRMLGRGTIWSRGFGVGGAPLVGQRSSKRASAVPEKGMRGERNGTGDQIAAGSPEPRGLLAGWTAQCNGEPFWGLDHSNYLI